MEPIRTVASRHRRHHSMWLLMWLDNLHFYPGGLIYWCDANECMINANCKLHTFSLHQSYKVRSLEYGITVLDHEFVIPYGWDDGDWVGRVIALYGIRDMRWYGYTGFTSFRSTTSILYFKHIGTHLSSPVVINLLWLITPVSRTEQDQLIKALLSAERGKWAWVGCNDHRAPYCQYLLAATELKALHVARTDSPYKWDFVWRCEAHTSWLWEWWRDGMIILRFNYFFS